MCNVQNQCRSPCTKELPRGIVQNKSNFEFDSLGGDPERNVDRPSKSLLAIPVGIKQKAVVDKLVSKVS
jgi:protein-tyrosine-phosphatase